MNNFFEKFSLIHIPDTEIQGRAVLIRVDFNVPITEGHVDDTGDGRIQSSLKTIRYVMERGGTPILISHHGKKEDSLLPIAEYLKKFFDVVFLKNFEDFSQEKNNKNFHGKVILFENLRQFDGELENDSSYLNPLISESSCYINEAFPASHRAHGSLDDIVGRLPSYLGFQFLAELEGLALFNKDHLPQNTTLVLGGAKFGTKLNLLKSFLPHLEYVLMGGALANLFLRERGFEVGKSFIDEVDISDIKDSEKIILPIDIVDQEGDILRIDRVGRNDSILDIGPETGALFETIIKKSALVLWNGPMGKYEDNYYEGSHAVVKAMAETTARTLIGGGDSLAIIKKEGFSEEQFDVISMGGGAMLEYLISGTLPVLEAYKKLTQ
ncbi:MAG: phosphoglycerate kinase [Candidatus Pacebacteria bacterium]|nr:phosphoglycerate kinase [Candidatus Paceibacterota bacterium]